MKYSVFLLAFLFLACDKEDDDQNGGDGNGGGQSTVCRVLEVEANDQDYKQIFEYNEDNKLRYLDLRIDGELRERLSFSYNASGELTAVEITDENQTFEVNNGRITAVNYEDEDFSATSLYVYDNVGRILSVEENEEIHTYSYLANEVQISSTGGESIVIEYDQEDSYVEDDYLEEVRFFLSQGFYFFRLPGVSGNPVKMIVNNGSQSDTLNINYNLQGGRAQSVNLNWTSNQQNARPSRQWNLSYGNCN